jgi:hypothetical protein
MMKKGALGHVGLGADAIQGGAIEAAFEHEGQSSLKKFAACRFRLFSAFVFIHTN